MSKKRLIIASTILIVVTALLAAYNIIMPRIIAGFILGMKPPAAVVAAEPAKAVDWTPSVAAIGTVNAAQGVDLSVETAGVVHEITFAPNSTVAAGDVLLRLDDDVQAADLAAAQLNNDLQQTALTRAKDLSQKGVASDVTVDAAEAQARAASAELARAQAALDQRHLTAPFGGTIGIARVDLGQYITPGTVVATLQDLSALRVDFSLPEQDLPLLALGQVIEVLPDGSDTPLTGKVTGIDPRVDPATRLVALRGEIAAGGNLTPGQFVRLRLVLPTEKNVIALPQTAVTASLFGDFVYALSPVADDPATADVDESQPTPPAEGQEAKPVYAVAQVFVQTGRRSGGYVEVKSGIATGDLIVTAGQNRLTNGQTATVDNSVTAAPAAGQDISGADQ